MASCDVQIAPSNSTTLITIESFMSDSTYRDIIENSANYNTRLCVERKLRMPFLDAQTGVAQNHSNLFMNSRQRMPGMEEGQEYTYPAKRWRKKRRQYLMNFLQPKRKENGDMENTDSHPICASETPLTLNEDSKDSLGGSSSKDESIPKETWYYDEIEMQEIEGYDEPDPDSDYDYEDTYAKKRKRRSTKSARNSTADSPMRRGVKGFGRGRRRGMNYTPDFSVDSDKPYYCDLCGARYKTRPGLTYHYTHSHKEKPQDDENSLEGAPVSPNSQKDKLQQQSSVPGSKDMLSSPMPGPGIGMNPNAMHPSSAHPDANQAGPGGWGKFQDSYLTFLGGSPGSPNAPGQPSKKALRPPLGSASQILPQMPAVPQLDNASAIAGPSAMNVGGLNATLEDESSSESDKKDDFSKDASPCISKRSDKTKANPSPYCDFCLGNEESNKKSGQPEELVSCSDCGRSGHPSCLQFTANMIISVRKYRWQCIECKCCSICGTSDNDDQLLFCDDCDRGYHMYCLSPPLSAPPEGSWSCKLCIEEFHSK